MKKFFKFTLAFCFMAVLATLLTGCEKKKEYSLRANVIYEKHRGYAWTDDINSKIHDDWNGVTVKHGDDMYFYVYFNWYVKTDGFKASIAGVPLIPEGFYYFENRSNPERIEEGEDVKLNKTRAFKYVIKNVKSDLTVDLDFTACEKHCFDLNIADEYLEGAKYTFFNDLYQGPLYLTNDSDLYNKDNESKLNFFVDEPKDFPEDGTIKVEGANFTNDLFILLDKDVVGDDELKRVEYHYSTPTYTNGYFLMGAMLDDWNGYKVYRIGSVSGNNFISKINIENTVYTGNYYGSSKLFDLLMENLNGIDYITYVDKAEAAPEAEFNDKYNVMYGEKTLAAEYNMYVGHNFIYMGDDSTNASACDFTYVTLDTKKVCNTIYYVIDYSELDCDAGDLKASLWSSNREMNVELNLIEFGDKLLLPITKEDVKPIYDAYVDLEKGYDERQELVAGYIDIDFTQKYIEENFTGFTVSYNDGNGYYMTTGSRLEYFFEHETLKPAYVEEDKFDNSVVFYYKNTDLFDGEEYIGGDFKILIGGGYTGSVESKAYSQTTLNVYEAGSTVNRLVGGTYTTECLSKSEEELKKTFTLTNGENNKLFNIEITNVREYDEGYHNIDFSRFDFENYDLYVSTIYPYIDCTHHGDKVAENIFEKVDANTQGYRLKSGEKFYYFISTKEGEDVTKKGVLRLEDGRQAIERDYVYYFANSVSRVEVDGLFRTPYEFSYDNEKCYFAQDARFYLTLD